MIAENATTQTTTGDVLRSGGQVKIEASKDGQAVYANKYSIGFKQPVASYQPMDLYFGDRNNADSAVLWKPLVPSTGGEPGTAATGTIPGVTPGGSVTDTSHFYVFDSCTDFLYINCDRFNSYTGAKTNINFVMPDTSFNEFHTQIFIVFSELNSVARVANYIKATKSFSLAPHYTLPVGYIINVIAISKKDDGKYYFSEQNGLTITDAMSIDIPMTERSLDYIKTRLGEL
jgi:hypothetical protein